MDGSLALDLDGLLVLDKLPMAGGMMKLPPKTHLLDGLMVRVMVPLPAFGPLDWPLWSTR